MTWKRLEGSGVSADLTAGLEAPIGDALWTLARQWQVGEFSGEDAASPVEVRVRAQSHRVGELRVGLQPPVRLGDAEPLEARVEAEPIRTGPARLRVSAEAGLQLLRRLGSDSAARQRLRRAWPLELPPDDGLDPRGRLELELLAARSFDAFALLAALDRGLTPEPTLAAAIEAWRTQEAALFNEPASARAPAWVAERLAYDVEVAAPSFEQGTRLSVRSYAGGRLDWDAFEMAANAAPELARGGTEHAIDTIPVPLRYTGMPAPRWWAFEDGAVYWGDIEGGPEDLPRYLVGAFATLYGDDWFVVPLDLESGALAQITSLEVLDSFGDSTPILSMAALDQERVQGARSFRWFELSGDPAPAHGKAPRLWIAPVLPTHEASDPLEEVLLMRDEASNLVWGIERVVEGASGRRITRRRERPEATPQAPPDQWTYRLTSSVPAGFIPFVPVRLGGAADAAIRLQRGRLAGSGRGGAPRGTLLEPERRLLLQEEEVPVSGVRLSRAYQMCRGQDGSVHVWMGRQKRAGRQHVGGGLVHDELSIPGTRSGRHNP
jgi:hypothetical protein